MFSVLVEQYGKVSACRGYSEEIRRRAFFVFSAGDLSDRVINPLIHKTALAHGDLPENCRSKNLHEFYIHFLW